MNKTALLLSSIFESHTTEEGHPERAARITQLTATLTPHLTSPAVLQIPVVTAKRTDLERVHASGYLDRLALACASGKESIDTPDCLIMERSFEIACLAAGSGIAVLEAIASRQAKNGFVVVRPPGHHAEADNAMGFCFINSIAVAAAYLTQCLGVERVLIIDWDVHHGNGTQNTFYDDDKVYFCSIHQHPLTLFPGTGFANEIGAGAGKGYTKNLPVYPGARGSMYKAAMAEIEAIAETYRPQWILVSAGFDAHQQDGISEVCLQDEDFTWLSREVCLLAEKHCEGRLVSFLEGGYNLGVLDRCGLAHFQELIAAL